MSPTFRAGFRCDFRDRLECRALPRRAHTHTLSLRAIGARSQSTGLKVRASLNAWLSALLPLVAVVLLLDLDLPAHAHIVYAHTFTHLYRHTHTHAHMSEQKVRR